MCIPINYTVLIKIMLMHCLLLTIKCFQKHILVYYIVVACHHNSIFSCLEWDEAPPQLECVTHHYVTHFVALIGQPNCIQMYFGLRPLEIKNEKKDSRLYMWTTCARINQCQTSWEEINP